MWSGKAEIVSNGGHSKISKKGFISGQNQRKNNNNVREFGDEKKTSVPRTREGFTGKPVLFRPWDTSPRRNSRVDKARNKSCSSNKLKYNGGKSQTASQQPVSGAASATCGKSKMMIFGQTEWSRLWAHKIYQFATTSPQKEESKQTDSKLLSKPCTSPHLSVETVMSNECRSPKSGVQRNVTFNLFGEERDAKNTLDSSRVLRNPGVARSSHSEIQEWEKGVVRRHIHSPSIQTKKDNDRSPVKRMSQQLCRTIRNDNVSSSITASVATPADPTTSPNEDRTERREQRKMRFEINNDHTSGRVPKKRKPFKLKRSVVIDGRSVAYDFGEDFCFDWDGIHKCAKYFMNFGCDDISIIVPESKMERGMTKNFHLSDQLKKDSNLLICWEKTNYKQFVATTGHRREAVIISNDLWKKPCSISQDLRHLTSKTIGFRFNTNTPLKNLIISERPFGPSGPTLDEMLHF